MELHQQSLFVLAVRADSFCFSGLGAAFAAAGWCISAGAPHRQLTRFVLQLHVRQQQTKKSGTNCYRYINHKNKSKFTKKPSFQDNIAENEFCKVKPLLHIAYI